MKDTPLDRIVRLARSNGRPGRQVASEAGSKKFGKPIGADILPNNSVNRIMVAVEHGSDKPTDTSMHLGPQSAGSGSVGGQYSVTVEAANEATDGSFVVHPSVANLAKLPMIKAHFTSKIKAITDDCKIVNRKYHESSDEEEHPYQKNCTRVVQALELRRRNYDVTAGPSPQGSFRNTIMMLAHGWRTQNGEIRLIDRKLTSNQINAVVTYWPENSRGWVGLTYTNGSGHILSVEKMGHSSHYFDGQSGKNWKSFQEFLAFFQAHVFEGEWSIVRVDDLIPNDEVLQYVVPRK